MVFQGHISDYSMSHTCSLFRLLVIPGLLIGYLQLIPISSSHFPICDLCSWFMATYTSISLSNLLKCYLIYLMFIKRLFWEFASLLHWCFSVKFFQNSYVGKHRWAAASASLSSVNFSLVNFWSYNLTKLNLMKYLFEK